MPKVESFFPKNTTSKYSSKFSYRAFSHINVLGDEFITKFIRILTNNTKIRTLAEHFEKLHQISKKLDQISKN